jgi:hypothetical protein
MKLQTVIILSLLLASCREEPAQSTSRPRLVAMDTSAAKPGFHNPYAPLRISPVAISYFPVDYPFENMRGSSQGPPVARVIYGRPHRQGRKIFDSLVVYGEPWRLGANEATEIEFFVPVAISGKPISKGRYTMYAIPYEGRWTMVLNSKLDVWGLEPDPSKDVFKTDIPVQETDQPVEYFSMVFHETTNGAELVMAWDRIVARLPITLQ